VARRDDGLDVESEPFGMEVPRVIRLLVSVTALSGALIAAGGAAQGRPPLTVYAAADLAFAFAEIIPLFEEATGIRVTPVLGSTGSLAKQIEHGAPADVFFAANEVFLDKLVALGALLPETRVVYARGRIVLATARAAGPKLADLRGLLEPRVRRAAMANPEHAPYGKAAQEALQAAGLWEAVRPKLVYGENVRHALQFLQTGAVEAGIVALSVADVPQIEWVLIDEALHAPLDQAAAVVARRPRTDRALAFIEFVNGPVGRPIMQRYGFRLPGES
jgi:molybdate transport system substrate-binding protein